MNTIIILRKWYTLALAIIFLAGCSMPTAAPVQGVPPGQPGQPQPGQPGQPGTLLPPPGQPGQPNEQPTQPAAPSTAFKFVKTVQVTPDEHFNDAGLGYIHYVPATDRFVDIIGPHLDQPLKLTYSSDLCMGKGTIYKEYTTDMQPTGNYGCISR